MPLVYATASDLETFLGGPPDPDPGTAKLNRWMVLASALVRNATRTAIYDTNATGAPSDSDVAEAFRNAVCAQVAAWVELDVDPLPGAGGVAPGAVQSSGIGGASVTWATASQQEAKVESIDGLVPEAMAYLADLPTGIYVWG